MITKFTPMCKFYILAFVALMAIVSLEVHGKNVNSEAPAPKDKAAEHKNKAAEHKDKAPAPKDSAPAPQDGSSKAPAPKKSPENAELQNFYKDVGVSSESGGLGPPQDLTQPELNDASKLNVKDAQIRSTLMGTLNDVGFIPESVKHIIHAEHLTPNYADYKHLGYKQAFDPAISTHIQFETPQGHVCSVYSWSPHSFYYYWAFTCSSIKGSFGFFGKGDKFESAEARNLVARHLGYFGVKLGKGFMKEIKYKLKYPAPGVDSVYEIHFTIDNDIDCHMTTTEKEGSIDIRNLACQRYFRKLSGGF